MNELDSFSFICQGYECDNEKDAWDSFKKKATKQFKLINGIKYWRRAPELLIDSQFGQSDMVYVVRARVFAIEDYIEYLEEAIIDGPYPQSNSPELTAYGLESVGKLTNG